MDDRRFYERLLGLEAPWFVSAVEMDLQGGEIRVRVEAKATVWGGDEGQRLHIHGYEERTWRHLDTCQLRTLIVARVPRVLDPESGKTQMVQVPWAEGRSKWTLMFEHFAIRVMQACATIAESLELLEINWHQGQEVMRNAVQRGLERRKVEQIDYVGLDDKSFRRGQDYISVMTDLLGERVLDVVVGRDQAAVAKLWELLPKDVRENVRAAAMDFGAAYAAATRVAAPQAAIVYDKYHVSQLLGQAVDQVRRQEHKKLQEEGDTTLTGTRYLWLTGLDNLSDEQFMSFQQLVALSLKTARAWEHKDLFSAFWTQGSVARARKFFEKWSRRVMRSRLEPLKKAARTFCQHLQGLLNYFLHPITNAVTEGLNNRIQLLKASARGFRNADNYRIRILFFLGKLDLLPALKSSHGF
jgi:transposase